MKRNKETSIKKSLLKNGLEPEMTLSEVGEILGISRQRVKQIETNALRKLRKYCSKEALLLLEEYEEMSCRNIGSHRLGFKVNSSMIVESKE